MTDRYTKTILTVIALSLVWLSIRDFVSPTPVAASQYQQSAPVNVTGFTPDALSQLSIFDPARTGRRGIPVILVNPQDIKLTPPPASPPQR
jgi:hypothetical protein